MDTPPSPHSTDYEQKSGSDRKDDAFGVDPYNTYSPPHSEDTLTASEGDMDFEQDHKDLEAEFNVYSVPTSDLPCENVEQQPCIDITDAPTQVSASPLTRVFQRISGYGGYTLTHEDLRLEPSRWLNDTSIDAYVALIMNRSRDDANLPTVYALSSYLL